MCICVCLCVCLCVFMRLCVFALVFVCANDSSSSEETDEISLIQYSTSHTHSLKDFMERQRKQCALAKDKLAGLRERIVSLVGNTVEVRETYILYLDVHTAYIWIYNVEIN